MGPERQRISHRDQCQFLAGTENPDINGPRLGPAVAKLAHSVMKYGSFNKEYKSPILAPPVARHGLPKKPCRKRNTKSPATLFTRAVGMQRITKIPKVAMYGGLRPIIGISESGENTRGPVPYPRT